MNKHVKRWLPLVKIAIAVSLMVLLYSNTEREKFREVFQAANLWYLLPIYFLFFFNTVLSSFKWWILLRADNIHVRLIDLVRSYLIAGFFNVFMPGSIGGDAYRIYDVSKRSSRAAGGFASVFADRFTGFFALAVWGLVFSIIGFGRLENKHIIWIPAGVFILMFTMISLLLQQRLLLWGMRLFKIDRVPKLYGFVQKFLQSLETYRRAPGLVVQTLAISLVFQLMAIYIIYLMGRTLGFEIGVLPYCLFVPLITLVEAIPISPFALGVRDTAHVFFFGQVGLGREQALSQALLYVAITLGYALMGGIVFMLRPRRTAAEPPPCD